MSDGADADLMAGYSMRAVSHIGEVDPRAWDMCAGQNNPFVSHDFLMALEESGAVHVKTGWLAQHLILQNSSGDLMGAIPLYLKGHSYGEYIFDWSWAEAYERAGGRYYPKLLSAVPFTPVNGPRLLVPDKGNQTEVQAILAKGLKRFTAQSSASSLHVNFCSDDESAILNESDFLIRHGHQFHWINDGYTSFDDFLNALMSRKRKAIKKERKQLMQSGIEIKRLSGDDIKAEHWDAFYYFYKDTYDRKWGRPYMNRDTFQMFHENLRAKILLIMAYEDGKAIAGALNFKGSDALYGRNWGAVVDYKFLHFEACYYQAIDYAIENKLRLVEAGTQGEHKIQRGYLPMRIYSAHYFRDEAFRGAIDQFLHQERAMESDNLKHMMAHSPFRQING